MLRSNSAEVMQQDIPICAWALQAQRPVSWRGLAPFYLGFFRDEVGVGGSAQAHVRDSRIHRIEGLCSSERPRLETEVWEGRWVEVAKCGDKIKL